jgi:hypothetical protein
MAQADHLNNPISAPISDTRLHPSTNQHPHPVRALRDEGVS